MISHRHRCIFVHQRKCAGTSIITAFGLHPSSVDWAWANDGVLSPQWTEEVDMVSRYFKFAVVRNPWDRFVSGWKYLQSTRRRSLIDVLRNPPLDGHDYRHLTRPQYITLFNADGTLAVDKLLRFENLEQEFREICKRVQIELVLPRLNVTRHFSYRHLFNCRSRLLFEELYWEDIHRFGYRF
jgi:chondroitin 4-sulfotransferase 11